MEGEKVVRVIDLGRSDPSHWLAFLQAVSGRPEGPPHLRITAVGEHRDFLTQTALIFSEEAEKLDIPFQFHAVVSQLDALNIESLRIKTGEALAITSFLKLHSLLASGEATATTPRKLFSSTAKIESFLAALWGLSPELMVVTEQESSHNGDNFNERFMEALNFYAALFDCLQSTAERLAVERLVFWEEIKNIIACEGLERKERHEKLKRGCTDGLKRPEPDVAVSETSTLLETQEFGEMMEHVDEVNFSLDGLQPWQPTRIRRASLLSLLKRAEFSA